jgi:hypothetical protein
MRVVVQPYFLDLAVILLGYLLDWDLDFFLILILRGLICEEGNFFLCLDLGFVWTGSLYSDLILLPNFVIVLNVH